MAMERANSRCFFWCRAVLLLLLVCGNRSLVAQNITTTDFYPVRLTCDYAVAPLGLDDQRPKLSWNIHADARNWRQSAYQILVASDSLLLAQNSADLWNSGKVLSGENIAITYRGKPLTSFANCWWKVRIWESDGRVSSWSTPAYWKMGILSGQAWKGSWIGSDLQLFPYQRQLRALPDFDMEPESAIWQRADSIRQQVKIPEQAPAVYIRKTFQASKKLKRATAYVCGLGLHELYLNGKRVGRQFLNPAYTDYQKRVLYNTYDVTHALQQGDNTVGVILGNGWYNLIVPHTLRFYAADYIAPPRLLMQLLLEYTDGSSAVIATDGSWRYTTSGPIVFNDILGGETYDGRKEMPGWSTPGYNDTAWQNCRYQAPPSGTLVSQQLYPVEKLDSVEAVQVEKTDKGYRIDLGRAICGWVKIRVKGTAGQKVTIHYLGAGSHTLGRYQTDYFILGNQGTATFEPRFSYNGFRYIEVEGLDEKPDLSDVKGIVVATNLRKVGSFSCSNEQFNSLQKIYNKTIQNYVVHIPNDPTREKAGWTQDIENGFDVNAYNLDVANMYVKWQHDFNDIIHPNGYVPPVVPGRFDGPTINGPWWGGMIVYNVIKLYAYYRDSAIITASYPLMKRYVGYLQGIAKNNIIDWGLGEWMEPYRADPAARPTNTPIALTSTIAYYYYVDQMATFAKMLNKGADARHFDALAKAIKTSYNKRFLDADSGIYAKGSQAAQLMSLHFGLVPPAVRDRVTDQLQKAIARRKGHLATGFVATPILLTTLSDLGLSETAYAMATQKDFPGWFDMIFNKGNTVMKENWEGGLVQMPSLAGPIGYWFYYSLAGIRPLSPGFKKIAIRPDFLQELSWVSAHYQSIQGEIKSAWKKTDQGIQLNVVVPPNTTALVYLPVNDPRLIAEGGHPISQGKEIVVNSVRRGETVLQVGSGSYAFSVPAAEK